MELTTTRRLTNGRSTAAECGSRAVARRTNVWRMLRGLDARWVMWCAIVLNLLLFVRIAVVNSPFYSYQGPNGADRVYYYAYAHSIVIDHDLDFANEFAARPPSSGAIFRNGRPLNKYPIGAALLSLPAFAVMHGVASGLRRMGLDFATDGYSAPYAMAFALSQMAFALVGMWLLYLTLLRYFAASTASLSVVAAWFGTNALHYTAVDTMMSHAAALFSTAWCGYEAVTLSDVPQRPSKWFRLGVSCAFVCLVRYQNVVFLAVPFAAVFGVLSSGYLRRATSSILSMAYATLGFLLACTPQLVTWKLMFGSWIANSYEREFAFSWRHPHLLDIFFRSPSHGLVIWLPVLAIGILSCLAVAAARADVVALAAAVAWLINIYIISSWWAWDSVAQRATFDFLLPVGLGMGGGITLLRGRWPRSVVPIVALFVFWNVPFAAIGVAETVTGATLFATWWHGLRTLL